MAMIRHRAATGDRTPTRLVYSSRRLEEVIYATELEELAGRDDGLKVFLTLTREQPPGWEGYSRRVDAELMREVAWEPSQRPAVFVCGSTGLRRGGCGSARRARARPAADQDRAFRSDGRRLMERLDGNAIGGVLAEIFGTEMTVAVGVCGSCGATGPVAELHVYMRAPGIVVRCCDVRERAGQDRPVGPANLARPKRHCGPCSSRRR